MAIKLPGRTLLDTKEAADRLDLTLNAVNAYIRRGIIKAEKFGRSNMIDVQEVKRYAKERRPVGRPSHEADI